jgi:hypothetical protein
MGTEKKSGGIFGKKRVPYFGIKYSTFSERKKINFGVYFRVYLTILRV